MPTIVADGTTELASAEFTLAQGESTSILLTTAAGGDPPESATVLVQQKTVGGQWMNVGVVGGRSGGSRLLNGPGTFRVLRTSGGTAYAVDRT